MGRLGDFRRSAFYVDRWYHGTIDARERWSDDRTVNSVLGEPTVCDASNDPTTYDDPRTIYQPSPRMTRELVDSSHRAATYAGSRSPSAKLAHEDHYEIFGITIDGCAFCRDILTSAELVESL